MRKLLTTLLIIPFIFAMSACDDGTHRGDAGGVLLANSSLENICNHDCIQRISYYRDVDTDIMYIYYSAERRAGISVYYNAEGKPMTYTEFKTVHMHKYHSEE